MSTDAWLLLADAPGLDAGRLGELLARFGSADALLSAARRGDAGLPAATLKALREPEPGCLERGRAWLATPGHHLIGPDDDRYPSMLRATPGAPAALFVSGDPDVLSLPQLAIVGSRAATPAGTDTARDFAAYLAARGFCITSGLAEGIDAAAHRGALAARGRTIAVCGTGLDNTYPRGHEGLAADIVAGGGALVSEFPPGTTVRPHNFPRRNRIISALSLGTLVVEASLRSGALITARHASEQGREVFAIPGSIHNPQSRGCHRLIRQGAKLVETAADIVEELGPALANLGSEPEAQGAGHSAPGPGTAGRAGANPAADEPDPAYAGLLAALGHDPTDIDTLVRRCGLTTGEVSSMLLLLELQGHVQSLSGGRYQRRRRSADS